MFSCYKIKYFCFLLIFVSLFCLNGSSNPSVTATVAPESKHYDDTLFGEVGQQQQFSNNDKEDGISNNKNTDLGTSKNKKPKKCISRILLPFAVLGVGTGCVVGARKFIQTNRCGKIAVPTCDYEISLVDDSKQFNEIGNFFTKTKEASGELFTIKDIPDCIYTVPYQCIHDVSGTEGRVSVSAKNFMTEFLTGIGFFEHLQSSVPSINYLKCSAFMYNIFFLKLALSFFKPKDADNDCCPLFHPDIYKDRKKKVGADLKFKYDLKICPECTGLPFLKSKQGKGMVANLKNAITREIKNKKDYCVFYHGTTHKMAAACDLVKVKLNNSGEFKSMKRDDGSVIFTLRSPFERSKLCQITEKINAGDKTDGIGASSLLGSEVLLSVGNSIFSEFIYVGVGTYLSENNSSESALGWASPEIASLNCNFGGSGRNGLSAILKRHNDLQDSIDAIGLSNDKQGSMYQIFIHRSIVPAIVYLSYACGFNRSHGPHICDIVDFGFLQSRIIYDPEYFFDESKTAADGNPLIKMFRYDFDHATA